MLTVQNVSVRYGEHTVLKELSFTLDKGQWLMLVGPNGAGKSSLISAIAQGVPYTGRIALGGEDVRTMRPSCRARRIGVLWQRSAADYDYTVEEIVGLGRYAHRKGFLSARDDAGRAMVESALRQTGMEGLRHKRMRSLSGGETQRAFLAQVLAQDPQILLLDEPANHLDLVYQQQLFSLIGEWLGQPGRAVLSVVHDLSLAMRYGTHAVLLDKGRCAAQGAVREALAPQTLERVYQMNVHAWMRELLSQWSET